MVAGEGGAGAHLEAGDVTAFLVDGDQHVLALGAQLRGQRRHLLGRGDVAPEQGDGGEPFAEPAQQPVGGGGAGEAGLEDGERVAGEGVGGPGEGGHRWRYPFTAPDVRPAAIFFCTIMKKATTGIAIIVDAAIRAP